MRIYRVLTRPGIISGTAAWSFLFQPNPLPDTALSCGGVAHVPLCSGLRLECVFRSFGNTPPRRRYKIASKNNLFTHVQQTGIWALCFLLETAGRRISMLSQGLHPANTRASKEKRKRCRLLGIAGENDSRKGLCFGWWFARACLKYSNPPPHTTASTTLAFRTGKSRVRPGAEETVLRIIACSSTRDEGRGLQPPPRERKRERPVASWECGQAAFLLASARCTKQAGG